mmetsp:Transcript_4016/g.10274  ORF Transcript_4016/g.10274 Transcript_4016/m.10274 type:complete len:218 (+) Transcript_4016:199-852(+)
MPGGATRREMETTAYCSCGKCCCWEHGLMVGPSHYLAMHLKPFSLRVRRRRSNPYQDKKKQKKFIFDRYWTATTLQGCPYEGLTAVGELPRQARPGPLNARSLGRPVVLAARACLFPWFLMGQTGTIAADLDKYPFGTRMYVPGYGWGRVEDKGAAIKGEARLDLFFHSHEAALQWGRQRRKVKVVPPNEEWVDRHLPQPLRTVCKRIDRTFHAIFS